MRKGSKSSSNSSNSKTGVESIRQQRVSEIVRSVVAAELIAIGDWWSQRVTVSDVRMTADLRLAWVYWTFRDEIGTPKDNKLLFEVEQELVRRKTSIKKGVASNCGLKFVPDLKFFYDTSLDNAKKIDKILNAIPKSSEIDE